MDTNTENASTNTAPAKPVIKIIGVGGAGVALVDAMNCEEFAGASFVAVDTDGQSLAVSTATVKIHLETKMLRGLGTGGDPERGRTLAEEQYPMLKSACEGAQVIFIVSGFGGGAGSGISPVLARAAKETGALVLGFVTIPFACEGNRRQQTAEQSIEQMKTVADGVISLPSQKTFKLIDENTSVLETFRITGSLLIEGVRGIWQLITRPSLIQIHFEDLCSMIRDRHADSAFAFVEAAGPARSREAVDKLLAHPLLDEGRALAEANAVLVSLTGGKDLTMAEVNRVMEQVSRHCERAQIIMGAAIDGEMKNRMSVTVIAARFNTTLKVDAPAEENGPEQFTPRINSSGRSVTPGAFPSAARDPQPMGGRRGRRGNPKLLQGQLPLAIVSRGRFDKSEPTIYKGEDLDIPTYLRRGVPLN